MSEKITLRGFVATDVTERTTNTNTSIATFRVGCSDRRFNQESKEWETTYTNWYTINCFRNLANHVAYSIRKGQPVIITGRLKQKSWQTKDGDPRTTWEVDAEAVGHDLVFGSTSFERTTYQGNQGQTEPQLAPVGGGETEEEWGVFEGSR
ncbi:single-stranded DNA-binding protein [Micrococcoides hystricis]|uniref:Single-stranded DNA-binding protein n=1 Tax=Micrococcoides hystricis TaxID=1572761 RepID=A0ABV6P8U0_9MICC